MAGFSASNPSAQPNKWKKDGQIFAVRHRGVDYFPGYALDTSTDYRPTRGLARVLGVFHGRKDDWGLAYWFASVNSFLGGNPTLDTLSKATDVLGYKLTLVPKERIVRSSAIGRLSGQRATAAKAKKRA
jgi:hypothetical protein